MLKFINSDKLFEWIVICGGLIPTLLLVVLPLLSCFFTAESGMLLSDYPQTGTTEARSHLSNFRTPADRLRYMVDMVPKNSCHCVTIPPATSAKPEPQICQSERPETRNSADH